MVVRRMVTFLGSLELEPQKQYGGNTESHGKGANLFLALSVFPPCFLRGR